MSVESIPTIEYDEPGLEVAQESFVDDEVSLTEQVERVERERGRVMSAAGRIATRAFTAVGLAAVLVAGPGEGAAEAAPAPCYKGVERGVQVGRLCVTKRQVRASGDCDIKQMGGLIGIAGLVVPVGAVAVGLGVVGVGATYYEEKLKAAIC